ncbi:MAG: pyridoxal phosphate-dependent aminotransferase [Proteobacteria bacterium]|nr:pyridoxal phosphate-dependent aminotransferase [Pseudomonadota bacterium]
MFLQDFPPMGVYETLFKFQAASGSYMGDPGTHPWAQGFPLTRQLPGGPEIPLSVSFAASELKYPAATGNDGLRKAIAKYYNHFYGSKITEDNVGVFAGGRPGIFATLLFLQKDVDVIIEETEYTPYFDKLKLLNRSHRIVPSNPHNNFRPSISDYRKAINESGKRTLLIRSNPCNPTGVTWSGDALKEMVNLASGSDRGAIIDEAYEFFNGDGPVSAMQYISNIDESNIFVIGAATKGLQVPGMRTGWVIASKRHIEVFRNFSSIAMGGVSRPSQVYVTNLLDLDRVTQARKAVVKFYNEQRKIYRDGLASCGMELSTGDGGFYHWGKLPHGLTAEDFNQRLFKHKAAILPGTLCDMHRRGAQGPHNHFIRFSFGPIEPDAYQENMRILKDCLKG